MAGIEHGNVTNEEFLEEVARYECVYNRNSKNFKDKTKRLTFGKKSARNLIYLVSSGIFFDVSFDYETDVVVALGLKKIYIFACTERDFLLDIRHVVRFHFPPSTTREYI